MEALHPSLDLLRQYPQFILYKLEPRAGQPGKMDKIPIDYRIGKKCSIKNTGIWMTPDIAITTAKMYGNGYGVGFVITENDPFCCIDIDNCLDISNNTWSSLSTDICTLFYGAATEVSQSGRGLHIFFCGTAPSHSCRNDNLGIEFYTKDRFIALTGAHAAGDASKDFTDILPSFVQRFFLINGNNKDNKNIKERWHNQAVKGAHPDYFGTNNDDELIQRILKSEPSSKAIFGDQASFLDLWETNESKLSLAYPPNSIDIYNRSSADMALACHLAFWTGKDCLRIEKLMRQSKLHRDKWDNQKDYLKRTILQACDNPKVGILGQKESSYTTLGNDTQALGPVPLPELPPVLPFDYSYLPEEICDYVRDISERMQCPPDFVAISVYVMLATVCGRKVRIRPKEFDNWTVTPNLWGAAIGHSGVKKSPALNESLIALKKLEAKAYDEFNKAKSEYEIETEIGKVQKSADKKEATKIIKTNIDKARELLKPNDLSDEPTLNRYSTNDVSYEALGELLIENPNGVMAYADEIIGLLKRLDAPGQEAARAFFLTAADGNQSYIFDRIGRGKGLRIEATCLSILGGVQPGVIAEYVRHATNGGAGADGLLQRFGLMVYPDISPQYEYIDRLPNKLAREKVTDIVERINKLNPLDIGAESDVFSNGTSYLRLDSTAQIYFSEWDIALQHRLRSGEEHPAIISHLSKYPKLILSLALLNHLCDSKQGAVSETAFKRAIAYGEYLESHARRVYSFATSPEIEAAKTVLKRLASGKLSNPFTAREISQKGWAGLSTSKKTLAAINILIEYGHLTEEIILPTAKGGRQTTFYHWNKTE